MRTTFFMFVVAVAIASSSCKRDRGHGLPIPEAKEGSKETWAFTKGGDKLYPLPDWMKKFVKQHPDAIADRVVLDDNIVLAASTSELQRFVLEHVDGKGFFGGAMELKRKTAPGGKD